ncbi:MAG: CarD family transcriptional regulator, partial [Oscillospiraceae bacterium]
MKIFQNVLLGTDQYSSLIKKINANQCPVSAYGLSNIHKALLINSIVYQTNRQALVFCGDEAEGRKLCEDINAFLQSEISAFYPARDFVMTPIDGISKEFENERLMVLGKIVSNQIKIVVTCGDGAIQNTIPKNKFEECVFSLKSGDSFEQEKLIKNLITCGYVKRSQVDGICQFSTRGGIVDFFPPHFSNPVRIEFWGDDIDNISEFDIVTQRRTETLEKTEVAPAREVITQKDELLNIINNLIVNVKGAKKDIIIQNLEKDIELLNSLNELTTLDKYLPIIYKKHTLLDYFRNPIVFISDYTAVSQRIKDYSWQLNEDVKSYLEQGVLTKQNSTFSLEPELFHDYVKKSDTILIDTFAKGYTILSVNASYNFNFTTISVWSGLLSTLLEDLSFYNEKKYCVLISVKNEKSAENLCSDLIKEGYNCTVTDKLNSITLGKIFITCGNFSSGFEIPDCRFVLLTQGSSQKASQRKFKIKKGEQFGSLEDLSLGDYVVHATHGVGVFDGISKLEVQGIIKDYIKIRYHGSDILFVPVTQLDLVARYLGNKNDTKVKLHKLNSGEWEKAKTRVKTAVKEMAKELIALYASRMAASGHAFPVDDSFQKDFDDHFE